MNDLPANYDDWLISQPQSTEEQEEHFIIEYGDETHLFRSDFYGTETEAKFEAKHLFSEYGHALLQDYNGNEIERW